LCSYTTNHANHTVPSWTKTHVGEGRWKIAGTCNVCGQDLTHYHDVDGTEPCPYCNETVNHDWELISFTTGQNCQTVGIDIYECSYCGQQKTESNDRYGEHQYQPNGSSAGNCQEDGWIYYKCTLCGDSHYTYTGKGPHNITRYGTDMSQHWDYCTLCSYTEDHEDHTVTSWTKTHVGEGRWKIAGSCNVCGKDLTHYHDVDGTEPCPYCNETVEHNWMLMSWDYGSHCMDSGWEYYECDNCGAEYTVYDVNYGDHEPSLYDSLLGANCMTPGKKYYRCILCGEEWTETGDVGSHNYVRTSSRGSGTCTSPLYYTYTCSVCNDSYETLISDDHEFTYRARRDYLLVQEATCESYAIYFYECQYCMEYSSWDTWADTDSGYADHSWSYPGGRNPSTCTVCGETCSHPNPTYGDPYWVDENYHDCTVDCPDCSASTTASDVNGYPSSHYWNDGYCTLCESYCSHSWSYPSRHDVSTCTICGTTCNHDINQGGWSYDTYGAYQFTEYMDGHTCWGSCGICGYSNHVAMINLGMDYYPHTWNSNGSGKCTACGASCSHSNGTYTSYITTGYGKQKEAERCNDCDFAVVSYAVQI
jgi:hypothetical protein